MKEILTLHDIVDPKTGTTIKEENLKIKHNIPLYTKVKYLARTGQYDEQGNDVREEVTKYVLYHARDCDGTPLYVIGEKDQPVWEIENKFYNRYVIKGIAEKWLTIVDEELPDHLQKSLDLLEKYLKETPKKDLKKHFKMISKMKMK